MAEEKVRARVRRKRRRPRGCCCLLPVLTVVALVGGLGWAISPVSHSARRVLVQIPKGAHTAEIADRLEREGVIRNGFVFAWYARLRGSGRMKAGAYHLAPSMTADEIIDRLRRGPDVGEDRTVTIPEGWTVKQISAALEEKGAVRDAQEFLSVVDSKRPALTAAFPLPSSGLEGYLFPDTYRFKPNSDPQRVAQEMLDTFARVFYEAHRTEVQQSGHSLHEIVTIASLIEREAEVPEDRATIAGVIENRLRRRMRLDIDATVLYALGHHKDRVLYSDLRVKSPYNTYRHAGLPPGPICCPGLPSLIAALHPERHDFLYYVAGPNRAHIFAKTEAEHNANVARMRGTSPNPSLPRRGAALR